MSKGDTRSIDLLSAQEVHGVPEGEEGTREKVVEGWGGEEEAQAVKKLMAEFSIVHGQDQALARTFKAEMRALLADNSVVDARALEDLASRIRSAGEGNTHSDQYVRPTEKALSSRSVEGDDSSENNSWENARADMLKNGYIDEQGNLKHEIPGWSAEQVRYLQDLQKKKRADAGSKIDSRRVDSTPASRDQLIAEKQQRQTELLRLEARIKGLKDVKDEHGADEFSKDAKRLQKKIEEIDRRLAA